MPSATIRISNNSRETLRELARRSREPMQYILDQAIEEYRRTCFLREANRAYETMRGDRKAWEEERAERQAWDATMADDTKPSGKSRR
jgi:predicted transcriptional regulator